LAEFSRQAFYSLTLIDRKAWIADVAQFSAQYGGNVPLSEKKQILMRISHKYANRARRKLSPGLQQNEQRIRGELMAIRREIRNHGTLAEKVIGCAFLPHKTVEWFLAYALRGKNEGIHGIQKKRGDLIGDGQHPSWLFKGPIINNRLELDLTSLKAAGYVYSQILGTPEHCLRAPHNWRLIHPDVL